MKVRNKTLDGRQWATTPPVTIEAGEVGDLPEEIAITLDPAEFELLEERTIKADAGLTVTRFDPLPPPEVVDVAKSSAGSVTFPDGTSYVWPTDGASLSLPAEHADQLREMTGEFGFDGDPAPEKVEIPADPGGLDGMKKAELVTLAEQLGLDSSGTADALRERIATEQAAPTEPAADQA